MPARSAETAVLHFSGRFDGSRSAGTAGLHFSGRFDGARSAGTLDLHFPVPRPGCLRSFKKCRKAGSTLLGIAGGDVPRSSAVAGSKDSGIGTDKKTKTGTLKVNFGIAVLGKLSTFV